MVWTGIMVDGCISVHVFDRGSVIDVRCRDGVTFVPGQDLVILGCFPGEWRQFLDASFTVTDAYKQHTFDEQPSVAAQKHFEMTADIETVIDHFRFIDLDHAFCLIIKSYPLQTMTK